MFGTRWGDVIVVQQASVFLREVVPPGGRLVTDYGGVLGYYTDGAVIEMWGLANAMVATRGDTEGMVPSTAGRIPRAIESCSRSISM